MGQVIKDVRQNDTKGMILVACRRNQRHGHTRIRKADTAVW